MGTPTDNTCDRCKKGARGGDLGGLSNDPGTKLGLLPRVTGEQGADLPPCLPPCVGQVWVGACGRFSIGLADQLDPVWPGSLWSMVSVERGGGSTRASGHISREAILRPVSPYPLTSFPHGNSHALCKDSRPLQPPLLSCSHTLPLGPPSLGHSLPRAHRAPRERA